MKKFLFFTTASLLLIPAFAQDKEKTKKIEASGNVITRSVPVQSFDELNASGVFSLHLSQGAKEEIRIEADDNLQELFEIKNEGSRLIVGMKKNVSIQGSNKMKVHVTFKKLKSIALSMVGGTSSEKSLIFDELKISNSSVGSLNLELNARSLNMKNESVGSVKLTGKADNAVIKSNSVGSIQAGNFVVQKMEIKNSGVGSAEVNAEKELIVTDSFLGKVKNKGNAPVKKSAKTVI